MDTLAKRLKYAMERAGMNQHEVAEAVGVRQPTIHKLMTGRSASSRKLVDIAHCLGVSANWLARGEGYMEQPDSAREVNFRVPSSKPPADVVAYRDGEPVRASEVKWRVRHVPVIDYVEAGSPREVVDAYEMGDGWRTATLEGDVVDQVGPHTFALEVAGDSMAPEFREGDTVVIDPDQAPRPGDIVVAKLDSDDSATLKKYRERGFDANREPIIELKPINEDYAPVVMDADNPGQVIGPVIEHRRLMRRPASYF